MTTTTIRVPTSTHERLQRLAHDQDRSIGRVIETLLDDYEKHAFFAQLSEDFARLRADGDAAANYDEEIAIWDGSLSDGLDDESAE